MKLTSILLVSLFFCSFSLFNFVDLTNSEELKTEPTTEIFTSANSNLESDDLNCEASEKEDAYFDSTSRNPNKKIAQAITDQAQYFEAFQLADCQSENKKHQQYITATEHKKAISKQMLFENAMMMDCGKLSLFPLLDVPGFPQIDEMIVCSGPDTLSLLVYNNSPYILQGVEIHVEFDPGLSYGGEVHANTPPATVTELNVSNPYTPSFLTSPIDSNALVVANIQVQADCDVNLLDNELSLDAVVYYQYIDEFGTLIECQERIERIGNYNSIIKVPVLNMLAVTPTQAKTTNLTDPACQTVLLSQDGIDAYVDEATFIVDGIDLVNNYNLASISINGLPGPSYTYDTIAQQLTLIIDDSYFPTNGNLNNGDNLWDENETVQLEFCYLIDDCVTGSASFDYKAHYGCNDEVCFDITQKAASVVLQPDFGAAPEITNSEVTQTAEFCGDHLVYEFTVQSTNTHPIEGLWKDISIRWPRCENDVTNTVRVFINDSIVSGIAWPATIPTHVSYQPEGYPNWRHLNATTTTLETWRFTSDMDGPGGLDDLDGDGRFDDLAGGESLTVRVEVEVLCAEGEIDCQPIECSIEQIEIRGIRDCVFPFQQFAPLDEPITYRYGRNTFANNEDEVVFGQQITENIVVENCDWTPTKDGFVHDYTFDKINIEACPVSNIYLRARFTSNRYQDLDFIRYAANSATYNGVAVPGVTFTPELDPISGDTAAYILIIPAGDVVNDNTIHQYYWNLEFTEQCASWSWLYHDVEVVEECMGCGENDPCEIIRSCDDLRSRVSSWSGCNCVGAGCRISTYLDTLYRCNFGYADKEMTQKLTLDDIPVEDQLRFLPGDTMYIRQVVEILDPTVFDEDMDYYWQFSIIERQTYLPGRFDKFNAEFLGWSFQDVSGTPAIDLGLPDCFETYPHATRGNGRFPSAILENLGVDSYGYWNTISQAGDDYFHCDSDSNINPEFPTSHAHYEILGNNVDDMRFSLYFRRPETCPQWATVAGDSTWTDNTCYEELMASLGTIDAGDKFYIEYKVPIIHNPLHDLQQLNEDFVDPTNQDFLGQELRPAAAFRTTDPIDCSIPAVGACSQYYYYDFHIPGPVVMDHEVVVQDCEITVNHSFSLSNQVPDVPVGEKPWYENEYRPFMYAEYVNPMYSSNLVYQGDARVIDQLGNVVDVSGSYDEDYSNLECFPDGNGGECCISNDGTGLSTIRFNDDDFYKAKNMPYAGYVESSGLVEIINPNNAGAYATNGANPQLCLNGIPLIQTANDPFPALTVGGESADCSWSLEYDLFAICPEELSSEDFQVVTQFVEPYFFYWPEHVGYLGHWNRANFGWDFLYSQELGFNPYANSGIYIYGRPTPNDGDGLSDYIYTDILFDPDASNGFYYNGVGNNPYRQSDTTLVNLNDFSDLSQDYPPLLGSFQNLLIADLEDQDDLNIYKICAGLPGSTGATHENVYHIINVPTNTDFIGFEDLNGNVLPATPVDSTADYKEYAVSTPDLEPGECFEFRVKTELLFCPVNTDEEAVICMRTSTGCFDYEKTILLASTADACATTEACFEYIKEEADIQVEWSRNAEELQGLCDTITLSTRIKNVKPARLINLHPYWYLPQGLHFVPGSFRVEYPGGPGTFGTPISVPDPTPDATMNSVFGTFFEYTDDAIWSTLIDSEGLVGILDDDGNITLSDSNQVNFIFDVYTECEDFVSGSSLWFQTEASDPCEKTIKSMLVESDIIIQNANPADFAQFYTFTDDLDLYCGLEDTLVLTYLNISPFGETQNSMMCIDIDPTQIDYMMGSLFYISPPNFNGNITSETINGNIIHVCMDVPAGIKPNEAFQIGLKVKPADDLPCGTSTFGVGVTSTIMDQSCAALDEICNVQVLNTVNSFIDIIYNPPVEIVEQNLVFECDSDPDSVTYTYNVELLNNGAAFMNNVTVFLHQDIDNNGSLDNYDPLLDSEATSVMLATNESKILTGQLTIAADAACPVILYIMQSTECICDAQEFLYTSIEPAAIAAFDGFATLCPGDDLTLPYCDEMTLEANPSAGASFTYDMDSVTISINRGYGISSPVEITASAAIDDCGGEDYSLYISVLDNFGFGPYDTLEVCESGCTRLDLNLPTSIINSISVQWTPTDYLDDPTSLYPTVCNPEMDITYEVELTFMDGGSVCTYYADYPIKVDTVPVNELFDTTYICPDPASHTYNAPDGYDNYIWYLIDPGTGIFTPIQAGSNSVFIPTEPGEYFLEYYNTSDLCISKSTPFNVFKCLEMDKELTSITENTNANEYTLVYTIDVHNPSAIDLLYDLFDLPSFDADISILSTNYTSDVGLSGALTLPVPASPGWSLADDMSIISTDTHTYILTYVVSIDLLDEGTIDTGDDLYTACGQTTTGDLTAGEGLFNQANLDVNNDGTPDVIDEDCGDLPFIVMDKVHVSTVETSPHCYDVTYLLEVENTGGAIGEYDLFDTQGFDTDFVINAVNFTTTATGLTGGVLPTSGTYTLADDQNIAVGIIDSFTIVYSVCIDLEDEASAGDEVYDASCADTNGGTDSESGEGLHNEATLDVNNDGISEIEAEACDDIPYFTLEKTIGIPQANPDLTFDVEYQIVVCNIGGIPDDYTLYDLPNFDNDIVINSATYNSTIGLNGALALPVPANPGWTLATTQTLTPIGCDTFTISVNVSFDLTDGVVGDDLYTACGSNGGGSPTGGEGLFNEAFLDADSDGDIDFTEEVCGELKLFDLALTKTTTQTTPVQIGDVVTFEITVCNQGESAADSIEVTDYIPSCMSFSPNNGWVADANGDAVITLTTNNGGLPATGLPSPDTSQDTCIILPIELTITCSDRDSLINYAEITGSIDEFGNDFDIDSEAGSNSTTENDVQPGDPADDHIGDDGMDSDGDGITDEDDHDPATVPVVDVALAKTLPATMAGPYTYGQVLSFNIEVINQGNVDLQNVEVIDYIPCGYSYSLTNNSKTPAWTLSNGDATATITNLDAGQSDTLTIDLIIQPVPDTCNNVDAYTNYSEVSYMEDDDGTDVSDFDIDSSADDDDSNDVGGTPDTDEDNHIADDGMDGDGDGITDEDDHDPERIEIFDLALAKIISPEFSDPVKLGQDVPFDIWVFNQGNVTATNIEITEQIPAGMSLSTADTNGWTDSDNNGLFESLITGPLLAGDSVLVEIILTVDAVPDPASFINEAEISDASDEAGDPVTDVDSTPDDDMDNDAGGDPDDDTNNHTDDDGNDGDGDGITDEDDHDPEALPIFDLALKKTTMDTGPFKYGDTITFDFTVYNQGTVPSTNIEITEQTPCGYAFVPSLNPDWTASTGNTASTIITDTLQGGDSSIVSIDFLIQPCAMEGAWHNTGEISGSEDDEGNDTTDSDIDSDADDDPDNDGDMEDNATDNENNDEDDSDFEVIDIFDLAQIKQVVTPSPYAIGQLIEYKITVVNQGNTNANNIIVTDSLPAGLSFDAANNPLWIDIGSSKHEYTITTVLEPLDTFCIPIFVTIEATEGGNENYTNVSEITESEDDMGNDTTDKDADDDDGEPDDNQNEEDDSYEDGDDDRDKEVIEVCFAVEGILVIDADCGEDNGSVTIDIIGSDVTGVSYVWSDGISTTNTANNLSAGIYTVTLSNGIETCNDTLEIIVGNVDGPNLVIDTLVAASCPDNSGSATLSWAGGIAPYAVSIDADTPINTGATTFTFSDLSAGMHSIEVVDANACKGILSIIIEQEGGLDLSATGVSNASCSQADGTATITVTPAGTYTYTWSDGGTGNTRSDLAAGIYTVSVSSANGCTGETQIMINDEEVTMPTVMKTEITCANSCNGSITTTKANGTCIVFNMDNENVSMNATNGELCAGEYIVQYTDLNGCMTFEAVIINEPTAIDVFVEITPVTCDGGKICVTNVLGGTGNYTYAWMGTGVDGLSDTCVTITQAGLYTLVVTDDAGCEKAVEIPVVDEACCFTPGGIVVIDAACGEDNGSATIDILSGDASMLTYTWSDGVSTTNTAGNLSAGTYSVTIENGLSECTQILEVIVGNTDGPNLMIENTQAATCPKDDGSVSVNWIDGTAPYSVAINGGTPINTGGTSQTFNNLAAGTYSIEVTDAAGCKGLLSIAIESEGGLEVAVDSSTDTDCGVANGAATISVTPAGTYTYTWSDAGTGSTRTDLASGVYTVTTSDANGCTGETTVLINDTGVNIPTLSATNVNCANACDGSIIFPTSTGTFAIIDESGATIPLTLADGNLCAGVYQIKYTDAAACMAFDTIVITQPEAIDVFIEVTPVTCSDGKICITNVLGGTGAYTYTWSGTGIEGLTDACVNITEGGIYTLNVMDENGCDKLVEINVVNEGCCFTPEGILVIDAACGEDNGSVTIDIVGGDASTLTYTWSDDISTTNMANNLSAGIYFVTIENGMPECTQVVEIPIGNVDAPNLMIESSNPAICPEENGSVTINWENGTAPFAISIDDGIATNTGASMFTFSDLAAGSHSIKIVDANGCEDYLVIDIEIDGGLEIAVDSTLDADCDTANGIATINVTPAGTYTYIWSDAGTGNTRNDLASGVYTVTATDVNRCTGETTVLINNVGTTMPSITKTDVNCVNACDGVIALTTGTGTFTITDENGAAISLAQANGSLCAGQYIIEYMEAGCSHFDTIQIAQPEAIDVFVEVTPITCSDGQICVTNVLGGTGDYTYTWSGAGIEGVTDSCVIITEGGIYTLNVMDENGCDKSVEINVVDEGCCFIREGLLVIDAACGEDNGSVTIDIVGGDESTLNYTWSDNVSTSNMANNLSAGIYFVTIENGLPECTQILEIPIGNVGAPNLMIENIDPAICPEDNGSVTISWENGTAPFAISIDDGAVTNTGASTFTFSDLAAGTHTIKIEDAEGCEDYLVIDIEIDGGLNVAADSSTDADCNTSNGAATISVTPVGTYTYIWSDAGTGNTRNDLASGVYTVTATDANGCTGETTVVINNVGATMPSITSTNVNCVNACDGSINLTTSIGTFTITDAGGATISLAQANGSLCAGQYIIEYMEAGCSHFDTVLITQPEAIDVFVEITPVTCTDGQICITNVLGGTGNYTYTWSGTGIEGLTDSCVTITEGGIYTLNVMDENGCDKSVAINVIDEGCCFTPEGLLVIDATCGEDNGSVTIDIVDGDASTLTYTWSDNVSTTNIANNLSAGIYFVTIENGLPECAQILEIPIGNVGAPNLMIESSSPAICPEDNGSVTVNWDNGIAPFDISIDNGVLTNTSANTFTFTDLSAGSHAIKIVDAEGCEDYLVINIEIDGGLEVMLNSTTDADCNTSNGGAIISVNPTGLYTYTWSDGSTGSSRSNLSSGVYNVMVNSPSGCSGETTVVINDIGIAMPNISSTNIYCANACDGSIILNTGIGTFTITDEIGNNISLTQADGSLCAGQYIVEYMEAGCSHFDTVLISQPEAIDVFVEINALACNMGEICITNVLGGNGNYTYTWTSPDGSTSSDTCFMATATGIYTLNVMDSNGCNKVAQIPMVNESCCFTPGGIVVIDAVCGDSTGSASVDILEGDETNIIYNWSNGHTTNTATNLSAGIYIVTIENGQPECTQIVEVAVGNVGGPNLSIDATSPAICPLDNGSVTISWTGGSAPYNLYSNAATPILTTTSTSQTFSNLAAGTYTFEVEDATGCKGLISTVIEQSGGLSLTADMIQDAECDAANGTATIGVTPVGTYTYTWSDGGTGASRTDLSSGIYTVSVNAANGCTGEMQIVINDALASMPIFSTTDVSCFNACDGSISLTPGTGIFSIKDEEGNDIPLAFTNGNLCAGSYTIQYIDSNGCNSFDTLTITQPDAFDVYLEVAPIVCRTGTICVTDVIGANGNYTYHWSGPDVEGMTGTCISVMQEAIYTLTVSDDMGCDKEIEIFVERIECVVDLALKKTTTEIGPFTYGDTITFDFTVYNQGNFPATNIEVTEYTPCGFAFDATLNTNWIQGQNNTVAALITDTLQAGDSSIVSIDLIIQACDNIDAWKNTGEITHTEDELGNDTTEDDIDSNADDDPMNDGDMEDDATNNENGDEDDSDFEEIQIFDLAQIKQIATPAPYVFGDTLTFDITVVNQGNIPATNIEITDHLPAAYAFDAALNPNWNSSTSPAYTYLITDTLAMNDTVVVSMKVILMMTEGDSEAFTNISEISMAQDTTGMEGEDADSDPDDDPDNDDDSDDDSFDDEEDDHDPETLPVFDLALKKTTTETGPFAYGDVVTFDFTIINQGNTNATDIEITEYTPCGFSFDNSLNPDWSLVNGYPTTTITNTLAASDSIIVSIDLIIQACNQANAWRNTGEISGSEDEDGNDMTEADIDSDADDDPDNDGDMEDDITDGTNGDEDDSDFEEIQVFDLALIKQLAPTQATSVIAGYPVEYQITVFNQGNVDAFDIEVVDYIPNGLNFSLAANKSANTGNMNDWNSVNGIPTYIIDHLAPLETFTITIQFTVAPDFRGSSITNFGEITHGANEPDGPNTPDADSNPDGDEENDTYADDDDISGNSKIGQDEDDHDPAVISIIPIEDIVIIGDTTITPLDTIVTDTISDVDPEATPVFIEDIVEEVDCSKYPAYCYHGLAIELMPMGMVETWASDVSVNDFSQCPDYQLGLWHESMPMKQPTTLAEVRALPTNLVFTCVTLGDQDVQLYITDPEGNWNFCETYINVQDNNNACIETQTTDPSKALLGGQVNTWKGDAVEEVLLSIPQEDYMTTQDGFYHFELPMEEAYTVTPQKNHIPLNGVSTFDLVLMTKHILGVQPFDNPYQWVAADVNQSKTVTAFDLVQLRKLILAIDTEFTNNTSWRFVDATYDFHTENPLTEDFPEQGHLNKLNSNSIMNFIAIKIGDINGNVRANSLQQTTPRNSNEAFKIEVADQFLKTGQTYDISFHAKEISKVQGYQFTLSTREVVINQVNGDLMRAENFGLTNLETGSLTVSWNQQPNYLITEEKLFTIQIQARKDTRLSKVLQINNRPTIAEAYDLEDNIIGVQLTFTNPDNTAEFELKQNQPNPFRDQTSIAYTLPGNSLVELILRDEAGRILKVIKQEGKVGQNVIQLTDLETTSGFIYYQLSTKFGTKSKKMLNIK